jgi:hypothetical protein
MGKIEEQQGFVKWVSLAWDNRCGAKKMPAY